MKQIEKMNAARNKAWPCVICKNKSTQLIYKRADYALARYGFKTEKEITQDIEYPLEIFYCSECNYAWNEKYSKKLLSYKSNKIIEAAPHSKTYQQFQKKMAENISNNLFDGRINIALEIGAGTGNFIKHINATRKIAFEPSEEAKQIPLDIEVINDYFNPTEVVNNADIIILRQVLEHIPEPVNFLREIISNVESKKNFYLYIEVPNSRKTFQNGRFQDFYFEHYSYFTSKTIAKISSILGTELETISNEMDGEILAVMLRVNNNLPNIEENIRSQERKIHQLIFETHRDKKKIAWGASGNGVVILNRLGIKTEVIEYVIDSDLNKQGKYIPGTQQLIVSPSAIACIKPDVIFIFSQLHKTEIQNQLKEIYKKPIVIETI